MPSSLTAETHFDLAAIACVRATLPVFLVIFVGVVHVIVEVLVIGLRVLIGGFLIRKQVTSCWWVHTAGLPMDPVHLLQAAYRAWGQVQTPERGGTGLQKPG